MPSLADLLENYRNWKGRQDWQSGKEMQDYFGGDPVAQEQFDRLSGFGTADLGGLSGLAGAIKASHGSPNVNIPTKTLYHGSHENINEIKNQGLFGGLFANPNYDAAYSHGNIVHQLDVPEQDIMTNRHLDDVSDEELKAVAPWVDDNDLDRLRKLVIDNDVQTNHDDARIMKADDSAEASWEAQRLRGALAKRAGFKGVEMNDEHGTSYLLLPGTKIVSRNGVSLSDLLKK